MGFVLAAGFLVSATIDIAMGAGLQRLLAHPASASRLQFAGSILCSIALAFVFLGAWLPLEIRFVHALVAGLAFRLGFAAYDIPQNALMALATTDESGRLRVASTRIWFSGAATLIVAAAVGPVVGARGNPDGPAILFGLTALFAIAAITSAWLLSHILRDTRADAAPRTGILRSEGRFGRRLPHEFWLLLFGMFATSNFTPAFSKLEPYFATYSLRSAWWGGVVIVLMAVGIFAGQPLWMRMCERMPRGLVMTIAAAIQIVGLAAFWMIGIANPVAAAAAAFAFGLGNGGVGMVQWGAFSETVARLGPARTGISYGLFAATGKVSLAAGGALLATALAGIDFRGTDGPDLVALMAVIPGIGAVCCAIAGIGLLICQSREAASAH
jgi:GPH family glycoside/pentoside/hexuronide:cation symporter